MATHETLELGIAEDNMNEECKNTEDVCSETTPTNTPAINEDDPQPVNPLDNQPDSNAILHSEQGKMIF